MRSTSVLLAALLAFVVAACSTRPSRYVFMTESDNDRNVTLVMGDRLLITLPANPTTGYQWSLSRVDASVLEADSMPPQYARREAAEAGSLGAGAQSTMRFTAVGKGETGLELVYHRPWETNPPVRTFQAQVRVK